ncbi:MEDS domain-containing protein [Actinacidiphila sp. DG2A-62]|uniref:MEDS domain-containing protein n=1 Tax=Actinacidiphila sp. DG2A-62 TaxID=3108821 RepID=UPI002DB75F06|nr:MEDS domain-containing protein [Actinacidiphila sp. DG2A-62]MEC3992735.1 MEDS domain-containing protein [Actinacidiphila sp. DG2A-62]
MRHSGSADCDAAAERHVAVEYSTDEEWAALLVPFVCAGLERGEQVQYVADATDPGFVIRTLAERGVDSDSAVRRGQFVVTTAGETYLAGGRFDPDTVIGLWHRAVESAVGDGYRSLRVIGEMSWATRDITGAERLLEYELRIHHEVFEQLPLTAWCLYDRRLLAPQVLDVLAGAHLTRKGAASGSGSSGSRRGLSVAPLAGQPGFRLSGSAGYESRRVVAAASAALAASTAEQVTLDLSGLDHLDVSALADIAHAARRRVPGSALRLVGAPPALDRMLELFPELRAALQGVGQ